MLIPFTSIDGKNIAKAEVEIPEQILNRFAISVTSEGNTLSLPHVRPGSFTRVMGDAPLRFEEKQDKLTVPDKEYKGIHVDLPAEAILAKLGFQKKSPVAYWHPAFGPNDMAHCLFFDVKTDDLPLLIQKIFNVGYSVGYAD